MTSVSFHLSTRSPDDSHLGIIASSVEAFRCQTKQLPDEAEVICCPYCVTFTQILLSASFQTCTSPTSVFKKRLQTMTLNRCVMHSLQQPLLFCATVSEKSSDFIPHRYGSGRSSSFDDTSLRSTAERGFKNCLKRWITYLWSAFKVYRRSLQTTSSRSSSMDTTFSWTGTSSRTLIVDAECALNVFVMRISETRGCGRIEICADRWLEFSPIILFPHQLQWLKGGKCGNNSSNHAFNFN